MRRSLPAFILLLAGCASHQPNYEAINAYYNYDFAEAASSLRADAEHNDDDVLLNNLRLGLAALAAGDSAEAERALGIAFNLLSTAGLNRDRTTAAVLISESLRIWKGEPFEQALAYYWVAALYATLGDWENVRAAAANAIFRLTDFGADQDMESLTRKAAADSEFLDRGYTAVDTNFALGFLMQAIGSHLSGAPGQNEQLEAALKIDPDLQPIADVLRSGAWDTLFLVDYGEGPTKIAYGPDDALVRFEPQERHHGLLLVHADGVQVAQALPCCNVDALAMDHRWNNLDDVRRAKSTIGNLLLAGGSITAASGAWNNSDSAVYAGLAMILAGALLSAGARADTRYLEFAPQAIYVVPVELATHCTLEVAVEGDPGSRVLIRDFAPGSRGNPRAVYLRMHGPDSPPRPPSLAGEPP